MTAIEAGNRPKISVLMVTYNHERCIGRALDSVFAQRHGYSFEIVVGDDASSDRTSDIVAGFARRHPGMIHLIRHPKNVGHSRNYFSVLEASKGEYVALLDGDDYWTDPEKLKKQVEFLDGNPEFVLSCHRFRRYYIQDDRWEDDFCPELYEEHPEGFAIDPVRFFSDWVTQTLTIVVRRDVVDIEEFRAYKYFGDVHICFSVLQKGKGYAHGFFGAVYNMHGEGIWSKLDEYNRSLMNYNIVSELRRRYRRSEPLKCVYWLYKHFLIWSEIVQRANSPVIGWSRLRLAWLVVRLFASRPRWIEKAKFKDKVYTLSLDVFRQLIWVFWIVVTGDKAFEALRAQSGLQTDAAGQ